MRFLRSIAFCVVALAASAVMMMPASASVPIDPGIHAKTAYGLSHPAPAALDIDRVAITADRQTERIAPRCAFRSPEIVQTASIALAIGRTLSVPDIRMRC